MECQGFLFILLNHFYEYTEFSYNLLNNKPNTHLKPPNKPIVAFLSIIHVLLCKNVLNAVTVSTRLNILPIIQNKSPYHLIKGNTGLKF